MALREIDDSGRMRDVTKMDHQREFDHVWMSLAPLERDAMTAEINLRLDRLVSSPDPNWGSITNTSIEGGKTNV